MRFTVEEQRDIRGNIYRLRMMLACLKKGKYRPGLHSIVAPMQRRVAIPEPEKVRAWRTVTELYVIVDNTLPRACTCLVKCGSGIALPYVACLDPVKAKEETGYRAK